MNSIFIAGNVLKRAFRKKRELLILTLLPIIVVSIMTFVSNRNKVEVVNIGIVKLDNLSLGTALTNYLDSQNDIKLTYLKEEEVLGALDSKKISFAVIIPENFTQLINNKERAEVVMKYNEADYIYENVKNRINQYIIGLYSLNEIGKPSIINEFTEKLSTPEITVYYQIAGVSPGQEDYLDKLSSMGFVITFIMLLIFISMGNLLEDKKKLTLARIFSFPVKGWEVVVGNILGSLTIGMMQLVPILVVLKIVFNIPWGANFVGVFLTLFTFLITSIGLGIGLTGIVKTNFNPILLFATVIVPTSILGGAFIPAYLMPDIVNKIGYIVPQKWVMDSLGKMLQGASITTIFLNIGIILMFGLAFATFGIKTLRPLND